VIEEEVGLGGGMGKGGRRALSMAFLSRGSGVGI